MIPNLLTLSRIFSIPFIVGCFYIEGFFAHLAASVLFIIACITDFLDGYFARQWKQVSPFGRFMDPVADKLLISTILLMLSGVGIISGVHLIAAIIILAREIIVSGLREYLSHVQMIVPVTKYAKWKTGMQMFSVSCLLCFAMFPRVILVKQIGLIFLWLAVVMTVFTGARYLRFGIVRLSNEAQNAP
ncbi:MAG: CDP-diacylglycerol--glycerol-3-phosphate 3-phosphatidyltransferase [Holosporaceae bacterium]|jgi:cardiolipin synthase|nr:CDP-diacylglycerol--glycerol-3-phosphate 3-phosphatidyltransferase [Holosporaceae bacterium]